MIEGFKDKEAEKIFNGEISKKYRNIEKIAKRKLDMLHFAHKEQDLTAPPSNRLESLKVNLKGFYSIRINDQFRIVFKFQNGTAYDVQIMDYH